MTAARGVVTLALVDIEGALYAATRAVVGDAQLGTGALVDAIRDRSARYTSDRTKLAKPASPKADLAARAAFFTIADAPKIAIPIAELASRGALPARPLRVVDLGAGCGAMSLGLIAALDAQVPTASLAITAIDRDRDALGIAANAIRAITSAPSTSRPSTSAPSTSAPSASAPSTSAPSCVTFTIRVDDAMSVAIPACDLVVMGTLLNELPSDAARIALVERALAAIADDGAVIVIEPALRETTRSLHVVRDSLIARGKAHVFAPCTRQGTPCPALADPTDWCHEHRALGAAPKLPPKTAELARLTHLRDDGLKFSYLVLRKQSLSLAEDAGAWRIVGTPWQQKGKLEVLACGNAGRVTLRLLKRHRAAGNRAIERVAKGHVVRVVTTEQHERAGGEHDRVEITDETRVEIVSPGES